MASRPPSQNDDDWPLPAASNTDPEDSAQGQWEEDSQATSTQRPVRRRRPTQRRSRAPEQTSLWSDAAARPLFVIGGVALLGMCALGCLALMIVLWSGLGGSREGGVLGGLLGGEETPKVTPGPTIPITQTIADKVQVNGTVVPPGIPTRLNIGARSFDVEPIAINDDREWRYNPNNKRAVYWAAGTLVNYVVGVHASTDNVALIETIQTNDLITLETNAGVQRYRVLEKTRIKTEDMALLRDQGTPRMTLVLFGQSGSERDVLIAQYTDEGTPNQPVAIGSPVNLGEARVVVLDSKLVPGAAAGLTEGKNYYQVNFRVTNIYTGLINVADFFTELSDGLGNRYQLSLPGSGAAGATGWVKNDKALAPGETVVATAGFEVPSAMQGPYLEWNFALKAANPYVARVSIGYEALVAQPTAFPTAQPRARIDISNAIISPNGDELVVVGTVSNLTNQPLLISTQDIILSSADGAQYPLTQSVNALPTEINPQGQTVFRFAFAKPPQLPVTFTLLKQSFAINAN
jgi:hypothetical protein